jgi:hypothetical protein
MLPVGMLHDQCHAAIAAENTARIRSWTCTGVYAWLYRTSDGTDDSDDAIDDAL